jgi:hypothetical protein
MSRVQQDRAEVVAGSVVIGALLIAGVVVFLA